MPRTTTFLFFSFFLFAANCLAQPAPAQPKKLVAVLDFDSRAIQQNSYSIYGNRPDPGRGIANLLLEKLLKDGQYRVVERKALESAMLEQNILPNERANPAALAKLGKSLGLDAIILGSITKLNHEEIRFAEGMGKRDRVLSMARLKKSRLRAVCGITVHVIDTHTGEILASIAGEGESTHPGSFVLSAGMFTGNSDSDDHENGALDTRDPNFKHTLMGEAVIKTVNSLSAQLNARSNEIPVRKFNLTGVIAEATDSNLIINLGSRDGLKIGVRLEVIRYSRQITDGSTGKVLKGVTEKLGEANVTEVEPFSATLNFSGQGPVKAGDIVKTLPPGQEDTEKKSISSCSKSDNENFDFAVFLAAQATTFRY